MFLVQLGGLEPPTSCATDRRSNQLSYNCILGGPPKSGAPNGAETRCNAQLWQGRAVWTQCRPRGRGDPQPPALIVAEGNYHIAPTISRGVWIPAFAGTTQTRGSPKQKARA